jgi:hypothetical protein
VDFAALTYPTRLGIHEVFMDYELDRQNHLAEARENHFFADEETLETSFGSGSFGHHELLDRAFMMQSNWEEFIATHPATLLDPERYRLAWEIAMAMARFYTLVGQDD